MVLVTVAGERWEVEFLGDESSEVERFLSNGEICGEESLRKLLGSSGPTSAPWPQGSAFREGRFRAKVNCIVFMAGKLCYT